jgi:MFS family permease
MKIVWRCPLRASWFVDQGKSAAISMNEPKTNTRYRWVIVAAGGLLGCVAIGSLFSLPVFLQPIARDTGWSISGVSTSMTIAFLAMALGSVAWGAISDRLGPRFVVLTGASS